MEICEGYKMALFKKQEPIDERYEFEQGATAVEMNDRNQILRHCARLLSARRTNPDGWILKAALQLHGRDFDIEKADKVQDGILSRAIAGSTCRERLKDAYSSYKRAISYLEDESKLYVYDFIFGYSMAFFLSNSLEFSTEKRCKTTMVQMLSDVNDKFGHDCSEVFYERIIAGYEQFMASGLDLCPYECEVKKVHSMLLSLKKSCEMKKENGDGIDTDDGKSDDFFGFDEDRNVNLTIMKGKKSCSEYSVIVSIDSVIVCQLNQKFSEIINVRTGCHDVDIMIQGYGDVYDISDTITITEDSILKIKIADGEPRYVLESDNEGSE